MPENSGKKKEIREFLQRVRSGLGFIEDIWIERDVKDIGTDGEFIKAKSLSGRTRSNLTELIEDDLKHCFEDNFFSFRFIAAVPGSGKTALLNYSRELIKANRDYSKHSVIIQFTFNDLLSLSGSLSFGVKFYSYILIQTFWNLLQDNGTLIDKVKDATENLLKMLLKPEQFAQLKTATNFKLGFTHILNNSLNEQKIHFE